MKLKRLNILNYTNLSLESKEKPGIVPETSDISTGLYVLRPFILFAIALFCLTFKIIPLCYNV